MRQGGTADGILSAARRLAALPLLALLAAAPAPARPAGDVLAAAAGPVHRVCDLIAVHADDNRLPRDFLARLIWKESRFDAGAVSPKGAQGIAQFMPGTAALRGLDDAFDVGKAIPASAAYLAELAKRFGNLGLAAAAYNAGEARVSRWLSAGGFLPLETENYVLDILGAPADRFAGPGAPPSVPPLAPGREFREACRALPVSGAATVAMASVPTLPWGVQVAGHFRRDVAVRQWQRLAGRHAALFSGREPVVSRLRSPRGRVGIHAVRIGAALRAEADALCAALRRDGGSCVVLRNR